MTPLTQPMLSLAGKRNMKDMMPPASSSPPWGRGRVRAATKEAVTMRAEAQTLVTEIEESLELLRRRL